MLTLASNNMTMLESVIRIVIIEQDSGKQHDGIGRHLDDIGRQHESQTSDWQQITWRCEDQERATSQASFFEKVNTEVFYAFHVHDNHSFAFA